MSNLCGDCPPAGYPSDKTRHAPCPRRTDVATDAPDRRDEAIEAIAQIEMEREGHPLSRTQQEIYDDAAETFDAIASLIAGPLPEPPEPQWGNAETVGNLIAQLRTLDPDASIHAAYHVTMPDGSMRAKVRGLHLSRERVVGSNIVSDKDAPLSIVAWVGRRMNRRTTPTWSKIADIITMSVSGLPGGTLIGVGTAADEILALFSRSTGIQPADGAGPTPAQPAGLAPCLSSEDQPGHEDQSDDR